MITPSSANAVIDKAGQSVTAAFVAASSVIHAGISVRVPSSWTTVRWATPPWRGHPTTSTTCPNRG